MKKDKNLIQRWSSIDHTFKDEFCELLSDDKAFYERFRKQAISTDPKGTTTYDFRGLVLENKVIDGGFFVGIDISFMEFINCKILETSFDYSTSFNCRFLDCMFETVSFWNCDLSDCSFENVLIEDGQMNTLPSKNCGFFNTVFKDSNFSGNDMSTWKFADVLGHGNELYGSTLPLTQQTESWWEMTPADRIRWI